MRTPGPSNRAGMQKRFRKAAAVAMLIALASGIAAAAGPDDRAAAEAALKDVESSPKKDLASEMVTRARAAQDRAAKLRASGDEPHARLADGLARTWAEGARDVVRAAAVEERARAARIAATDAGRIADRERALLEEGIAQTGRLRAQVESASQVGKEPARTSAQGADAGMTPPPKKAPPPTATKDGGAK